jgi:endonuclease-3 related protein
MNKHLRLIKIYKRLLENYGEQNWWPADSKLECAIGAILTQNTSWNNVEKAIINIKSVMDITIENLSVLSTNELSLLIRPSGFYKQKAKRIKRLIEFINNQYEGKIENMEHENLKSLRAGLLSINGIGPETADCILLYVVNKPIFVIDKYTYRLLYRHGFIVRETSYSEMQNLFMENLENRSGLFGEFHALIVEVGKNHCKKRAICEDCPINFDTHKFSGEII